MTQSPSIEDLVRRLREPIIADAFETGAILDGALSERLIRERADAADALSRQSAGAVDEAGLREILAEEHIRWNNGGNAEFVLSGSADWYGSNQGVSVPTAIAAMRRVAVSTPPIPAPSGEMVMVRTLLELALSEWEATNGVWAKGSGPRHWAKQAHDLLHAAPTEKKGAA